MSSDAWPSPDTPPAPLPRIEDLPLAEQGYDQEAVRLAFDSFYRHAAQLDASLRALEAVEVFRRDADALRNDLRALRALGLGGGVASQPAWATQAYARERPALPDADGSSGVAVADGRRANRRRPMRARSRSASSPSGSACSCSAGRPTAGSIRASATLSDFCLRCSSSRSSSYARSSRCSRVTP